MSPPVPRCLGEIPPDYYEISDSSILFPNKDWGKGITLLLFAVREAMQISLGFNPYELIFGHTFHGPLNLLKGVCG